VPSDPGVVIGAAAVRPLAGARAARRSATPSTAASPSAAEIAEAPKADDIASAHWRYLHRRRPERHRRLAYVVVQDGVIAISGRRRNRLACARTLLDLANPCDLGANG
jgi:hypothetical protein